MTPEHINELIARFLAGEALPEEALWLEDWRRESLENDKQFRQMENVFYGSAKQLIIDENKAWDSISEKLKQNNVKWLFGMSGRTMLNMAAAVSLIVVLSITVNYFLNKQNEKQLSYKTGQDEIEASLSDGTKVTVFANSELVLDKDFEKGRRTIYLKGSAYFSVAHDEQKPFIIDVGDVFIKDIGTRFNVRTSKDTDSIYVNVDEGVVLLFDSLESALEIKASQNAIYIKSQKKILTSKQMQHENHKKFQFSKTPLKEVIKQLNESYATTISVESDMAMNCLLTAGFNDEKIETVLEVIAETLGLTYLKTETGFIIKGTGCRQ